MVYTISFDRNAVIVRVDPLLSWAVRTGLDYRGRATFQS